MSNPLLITDSDLVELDIVEDALRINRHAQLDTGVFSGVQGNPIGENVASGTLAYTAGSHDGVIAFGGGSALDVGKAVAMLIGQTRPLWDFEDVGGNYKRIDERKMAPVVAVPTTSGTGSEVGRASVIIDETNHTKRIIFHPAMMPKYVICDPALTIGLPASVTAWTGMDALSHCLEAYCVDSFHPQADGIAMQGIALVGRALRRAVADGSDIQARSNMMAASLMGATAFQKGLGAMHAMSHPIGAIFNTHHGLTNAVVMPYVLLANRSAIEDKIVDIARLLDLPTPTFSGFMEWILRLRETLEIPHTLDRLGVAADTAVDIAQKAHSDSCAGGNPIPFTVTQYAGLLRAAISGSL